MSNAPLIYERMAAVLADVEAVGKERQNAEQRFAYRGIEDILNALHACLADHQVFYVPRILERIPEVRQTRSGASLWAVHLHVEYRFYTTDGSYVEASVWGEGTDMADKATSKAMTFAQKSALLQAFSIATADIDDPDAGGVESSPPGDGRDWYQQNGWADRAEHDTYRAAVVDLLRRAAPAEQAAFKSWRESEEIPGFNVAHTRDQAALVSANVREIVKDPEAKDQEPPHDEQDTPTPTKRSKPVDQRLAQRARELGLSAQERADVIHAITDGRTRTGKELSPEEVLRAEESLVGLAEKRLEFTYDEAGNPSLIETVQSPLLGAE